ncbi:MAG: hypothetical protein LBI20_02750 [Holosporales bacterium]|nr:hypothetical protein [Holosporales bacterium]
MDRLPGIVRGLHTLAEPAHYVIIAQVAARIWPALVPTVDETIASQIWAQQVGPFRAALNAVLDSPRFQMLVQRLGVPAPAPAPVARLVPAEAVPLWVEILDHSFGLNRDGPLWCAPVLGKDLLARITALREYFPDEVLFRSLLLIARKLSRLQKTDDPRPLMTKFCARLPEVKELKEEAFAARIHLPSPIEAAAP